MPRFIKSGLKLLSNEMVEFPMEQKLTAIAVENSVYWPPFNRGKS